MNKWVAWVCKEHVNSTSRESAHFAPYHSRPCAWKVPTPLVLELEDDLHRGNFPSSWGRVTMKVRCTPGGMNVPCRTRGTCWMYKLHQLHWTWTTFSQTSLQIRVCSFKTFWKLLECFATLLPCTRYPIGKLESTLIFTIPCPYKVTVSVGTRDKSWKQAR